MKKQEKIDFKLDMYNFLNGLKEENEEFMFLYYDKNTGETIGGIKRNYEHLISIVTDLDELDCKEELRGFIMNAAVNIINQYPEKYLETMKTFVNNLK